MTETATIAGITDEQLAALIAGRWEDDYSGTPGWERWVTDDDNGGRRLVHQWMFPSYYRPGEWNMSSGGEETWIDTLDEALKWCDNQAGNREIKPPSSTATKQEERFARWAA